MPKKLNARLAHLMAVTLLLGSAGGTMIATVPTVSAAKVNTSQIKLDEQAAVKKFNQKYANAKVEEITLESHFKKYRYEITGFDNSKEYTVEINAKTGKILKSESERLDKNDQNTALDLSKLISRKKATKAAEKAAKKGQAQEWTLESENGQAIWEITVVNGRQKVDVKVNANNGNVLNVEQD